MAPWRAHCRLLITAIIELFSLAVTAAALLSEICQNRCFLKGWVTLKKIVLAKTAKSRFVPPFGGLSGNVHGSSTAR